jgi:hypothetical protein
MTAATYSPDRRKRITVRAGAPEREWELACVAMACSLSGERAWRWAQGALLRALDARQAGFGGWERLWRGVAAAIVAAQFLRGRRLPWS